MSLPPSSWTGICRITRSGPCRRCSRTASRRNGSSSSRTSPPTRTGHGSPRRSATRFSSASAATSASRGQTTSAPARFPAGVPARQQRRLRPPSGQRRRRWSRRSAGRHRHRGPPAAQRRSLAAAERRSVHDPAAGARAGERASAASFRTLAAAPQHALEPFVLTRDRGGDRRRDARRRPRPGTRSAGSPRRASCTPRTSISAGGRANGAGRRGSSSDAEFVHLGGTSSELRWSTRERSERIGRAEAEMIRDHLAPARAALTIGLMRSGLAARVALSSTSCGNRGGRCQLSRLAAGSWPQQERARRRKPSAAPDVEVVRPRPERPRRQPAERSPPGSPARRAVSIRSGESGCTGPAVDGFAHV